MRELGILNEGYGRIIFSSLLSFLPSGMMLPLSLITVVSAPLTTYSLWNNLLLIGTLKMKTKNVQRALYRAVQAC